MREYKHRGKRKDNGFWVYGNVVQTKYGVNIVDDSKWYEVDPETVGQYTGLSDKNGKEIYERDIWLYHGVSYVVSWNADEAKYYFKHPNAFAGDDDHIDLGWSSHGELIGNIHDNPELLGG